MHSTVNRRVWRMLTSPISERMLYIYMHIYVYSMYMHGTVNHRVWRMLISPICQRMSHIYMHIYVYTCIVRV